MTQNLYHATYLLIFLLLICLHGQIWSGSVQFVLVFQIRFISFKMQSRSDLLSLVLCIFDYDTLFHNFFFGWLSIVDTYLNLTKIGYIFITNVKAFFE